MLNEDFLIGKRIKLLHTSDSFTRLKAGDLGTVVDVDTVNLPPKPFTQVWVEWDSGSSLALIVGEDKFEVLE